ncbi:hypothetical protein [Microbacterium luteum]|uniref:hypothetical protein n=1 Tax=Microbacterium luteum TaxID=2782167 RepID=UPI0018874603|nr:hypothetical protein [Microbacterium luteum]
MRWRDDEYSIVDGQGKMLSAEQVEDLRAACEATLSGTLLAVAETEARAEARHNARASVIRELLEGNGVQLLNDADEVIASVATEALCEEVDGEIRLIPADRIDMSAAARLFRSLFENTLKVEHLGFMTGRHHDAYVLKLIDGLTENQAYPLDTATLQELKALTPHFPSVWLVIANNIPMYVAEDPGTLELRRVALWEAVISAVRSDFANPFLRGYLYDVMGVTEIETATEVLIKAKSAPIAGARLVARDRIGKADDELASEVGTRHPLFRVLPDADQPWEHEHPDS